jgi:hypothetical protein
MAINKIHLSEFIQISTLLAVYIMNIMKNYQPYSSFNYRLSNEGWAVNGEPIDGSIKDYCTIFSKESFESLINLTDKWFWLVASQYWLFVVIIIVTQIVNAVNRKGGQKGDDQKGVDRKVRLILVLVKLFFAPSVFVVSGIDYTSPCLIMNISTGFLYVAEFANVVLVIALYFTFYSSKKSDEAAGLVICCLVMYCIAAGIFYIALYFGPIFTKIESGMLTFVMIIDVITNFFDNI